MNHVKRILLLIVSLVLLSWASPGEALSSCDYEVWQMSNGFCVYSLCYGTGCQALDCVYNDGSPEVHLIRPECGVGVS